MSDLTREEVERIVKEARDQEKIPNLSAVNLSGVDLRRVDFGRVPTDKAKSYDLCNGARHMAHGVWPCILFPAPFALSHVEDPASAGRHFASIHSSANRFVYYYSFKIFYHKNYIQ